MPLYYYYIMMSLLSCLVKEKSISARILIVEPEGDSVRTIKVQFSFRVRNCYVGVRTQLN